MEEHLRQQINDAVGSLLPASGIRSLHLNGKRSQSRNGRSPIFHRLGSVKPSGHQGDTENRRVPSRLDKTDRGRHPPRVTSFDESVVVVEASEWQSIRDIRTAQKAGLFLAVMLCVTLIPAGPWLLFPNQAEGVVWGVLLWLLTLLSVSIVLAAALTILVLSLPSRPFRFEVRQYRR